MPDERAQYRKQCRETPAAHDPALLEEALRYLSDSHGASPRRRCAEAGEEGVHRGAAATHRAEKGVHRQSKQDIEERLDTRKQRA